MKALSFFKKFKKDNPEARLKLSGDGKQVENNK